MYNQRVPDKSFALQSLAKSLGEERAEVLWRSACKKAGIFGNPRRLSDLEKIFNFISNMDGAVGVIGKSLSVRLITYRTLSQQN